MRQGQPGQRLAHHVSRIVDQFLHRAFLPNISKREVCYLPRMGDHSMILSLAREIGVAGLLALSLVVALSAQLPTKRVLTLEAAKKIAAAAEAEARKNKWNVVNRSSMTAGI